MAEIRVERKRRSLLPVLLALLLVVLLAWWWLGRTSDGAAVAGTADTTMTTDVGAAPGTVVAMPVDTAAGGALPATDTAAAPTTSVPVEAFTSFVANSTAERDESQQHEYTAGGLRRLASALESMNPGGASQAQIDLMRQKADSLQGTSTGDDRHADMARAAFNAAGEVMRSLPGASGASTQLQAVTRAAGAVVSTGTLLDQKDRIQAFFDSSREALRAMSGAGAT